jgi:hypothetical protein
LLVFISIMIQLASLPQMVLVILEIIAYIYWPMLLVFLIMISRLRKDVPELNG